MRIANPVENNTSEAKCAPIAIRDNPTKIPHPIIIMVPIILMGLFHSFFLNGINKGTNIHPIAVCPLGKL
jgi:hypothetical protein